MRANRFRLDHDEEAWRAFMDKINNGGWDYLEKMASTYEQDVVNSLVSINVCPSCESRLIEEYIDGKTIVEKTDLAGAVLAHDLFHFG